MRKIQNIQALRGIAVLAVVLFHFLYIEEKYGGSETLLPDVLQFGMIGVDLFFVISGFVMVTVTRGKFQKPKEAIRFIYHRLIRIYPIYWVYTLLLLIVYFIQRTCINNAQGNQVDILASFLLLPSHILPLVVVGWTLIHEVYFYLIFFIILLLTPERYLMYTVLLWGIGVGLLNFYVQTTHPVIMLISHPLTIEFIAGCLLAIMYFKKDVKIRSEILLIIVGLGLATSVYGFLCYQNITGSIVPLGWWRVIIFGFPASLTVYCLTIAERNGWVIHSSIIRVGDASCSIYLSHLLTISAFGRIWSLFSIDGVLDNIIMIPIILMLVLIVGFLSYLLVEKPLLKLSRRIA